MASTATEQQLDQLYRRSQLALSAATVRDALRLWPALRFADLRGTYPAWLAAMLTLVERNRQVSTGTTSGYLSAAWLAAGNAGAPPLPTISLPTEQVETSLRVTSIVAYRRSLAAGMTARQANESAAVQMSGSAQRMVLEAGRLAALEAVQQSGARWARIASPTACDFCKMLASRGYAYRGEETASFAAHDHCGCSVAVNFAAIAA